MKKVILLLVAIFAVTNLYAQERQMQVTDGTNTVVFTLNSTDAANALWKRLPITASVSNYSNNEKIFYPDPELDYGTNNEEGDCPAGTLALFSPWGNIVMYYGHASRYSGLYILGSATSGSSDIRNLSGTITASKVSTTGINSVKNENSADNRKNGNVYDLQGRKVADDFSQFKTYASRKGLYVVNGRKIIVN